jgi:O-antigen/teichoic acid export membrane protein
VVGLIASVFVLSFSIRRLGPRDYGAVVAITSAVTILTLFSGAIRYAVVRSGARFTDLSTKGSTMLDPEERAAVRAAHALFIAAAVVIFLLTVGLGWLIPLDLHLHGQLALQVYIASLIFVASAAIGFAFTAYAGVLTGREQFGRLAQIALVGLAVQVVGTVLLAGPLKIIGLALAALISSAVQQVAIYALGRRRVPWLNLVPRRPPRSVAVTVLRYAAGLAVLSATSTICSASDAFIIGAVSGGAAVTTFRIGSIVPTNLVTLLYRTFAVLFPRLARSQSPREQEEAVGWTGCVVGWSTGVAFACLGLLGADIVRLLLGRPDWRAEEVLWISAAALAVDASYHGVVQVVFARGEQGFLAKYSWIELTFNLAATYIFVRLQGPVGSAWALAATIVVTDIVGFPFIMRGHWGSPAGRFVLTHGVLQSFVAGALVISLGILPIMVTHGLGTHLAIAAADGALVLFIGISVLGAPARQRLRGIARSNRVRAEA